MRQMSGYVETAERKEDALIRKQATEMREKIGSVFK